MNAVLNYLKTHQNYGLYGLSRDLCNSHNLRAIHSKVSGDGILHLSRMGDTCGGCDPIHNDSTLLLLDDAMDVIGVAPSAAQKLAVDDIYTLPLKDSNPAVVSELLIGKLVVVSLYKQTYIISTKDDLHGTAPIYPGVAATTQEIFLDLLDRIDPMNGLDGLFKKNRGGINCRCFSYTFVLSPRNGKFTDKFLDYDMYMVALYDRTTHMFKTPEQIKSLCQQLNGASTINKIKLPTYTKVYSIDQLHTAIDKYTKYPNVRGVYLLDSEMIAAYIVLNYQKVCLKPEKYLKNIVEQYLKYDYVGVLHENRLHPKLAPIIHSFIKTYQKDAEKCYAKTKNIRTKRTFYDTIKGHKTEHLLCALRSGRAKSVTELHKVFTPKKVIRMLLEEYGAEKINNLIEEQEINRRGELDVN